MTGSGIGEDWCKSPLAQRVLTFTVHYQSSLQGIHMPQVRIKVTQIIIAEGVLDISDEEVNRLTDIAHNGSSSEEDSVVNEYIQKLPRSKDTSYYELEY